MPAVAQANDDEYDLGTYVPRVTPGWGHGRFNASIYGLEITEAPLPSMASLGRTDTTSSLNAGDRVMLEKIRELSPESRRELEDFIEGLLDYEEDKRDSRAMRAWAARALAQDENDEADL